MTEEQRLEILRLAVSCRTYATVMGGASEKAEDIVVRARLFEEYVGGKK